MTTQTQQTLPPSIFPARFQILSGSALKLLACILMLIDHTGVLILANWKPALRVLFTIGSRASFTRGTAANTDRTCFSSR